MRPMCQTIHRSDQDDENLPSTPTVVVHDTDATLLETPERINSSPEPWLPSQGTNNSTDEGQQAPVETELRTPTASRPNRGGRGHAAPRAHIQNREPRKHPSRKQSRNSIRGSPGKPGPRSLCNIYFFMPYLHFETHENRKAMMRALEQGPVRPHSERQLTRDEVLMRAQTTASSSFLHIRRTLDQFFYHNIDTDVRDCDQVVYRFQKHHRKPPDSDPKIFMVDQLWMWVLGKDLVVTSFPERWHQPRNDPLNVLEGIIEDINSKTREPVQNVFELAMTISKFVECNTN